MSMLKGIVQDIKPNLSAIYVAKLLFELRIFTSLKIILFYPRYFDDNWNILVEKILSWKI